jgi:hypothetical protein
MQLAFCSGCAGGDVVMENVLWKHVAMGPLLLTVGQQEGVGIV